MAAGRIPRRTVSHVHSSAHGMAASDPQRPRDSPAQQGRQGVDRPIDCLSAAALADRLEEEINRAGRHGTPLSCLLVAIEDLTELASRHGRELPEQALAYAGPALLRELRRFDRVGRPSDTELLVVLPGADGPRGEIVARRVIDRLRAIKIEAGGVRRSLRVSVGLAAWREDLSGEQLLAQTRAAAARERNGFAATDP
jgi:diguanylate cyclase (GGDEF)-like protein